jgi:hypothetical protein
MNGGSCGTERWNIKTGTDSQASGLSLVPQPTTIATLVGLPAAGGGSSRESPTETTLWELKDVTLSMIKLETDSRSPRVSARKHWGREKRSTKRTRSRERRQVEVL